MKTYNICKSPTGAIEAVKQGWSWPGFFFPMIWAFVKGLNGIGTAIFMAAIFLRTVSVDSKTTNTLLTLGVIAVSIWLGVRGNELRVNRLRKKGYDLIKTVSAETPGGAVAAFMKEQNATVL